MDMGTIIEVLKDFGFPVACVIAMFLMWQREVASHKEEMHEMRDTMEEQSKATIDALNNNSRLLDRILQKLGE